MSPFRKEEPKMKKRIWGKKGSIFGRGTLLETAFATFFDQPVC